MKIIKPLLFSIFAVFIAVASSVASYIITASILKKEPAVSIGAGKQIEDVPVSALAKTDAYDETADKEENTDFKHYLVRLEGDKINVYVNYEEHEELLYGEQINLGDLSIEDKKILTEGKKFEKISELTEFTENFTS